MGMINKVIHVTKTKRKTYLEIETLEGQTYVISNKKLWPVFKDEREGFAVELTAECNSNGRWEITNAVNLWRNK
jgi:hypothetical protein